MVMATQKQEEPAIHVARDVLAVGEKATKLDALVNKENK